VRLGLRVRCKSFSSFSRRFVGLANFLEEKLNLRVDVVSDRAIRHELKEQILKEVVRV
jgi:predicted nucleotidyltransferase